MVSEKVRWIIPHPCLGALLKLDWWLIGICSARAFTQAVATRHGAALTVLQKEWDMSAAATGGIAGGYQVGLCNMCLGPA